MSHQQFYQQAAAQQSFGGITPGGAGFGLVGGDGGSINQGNLFQTPQQQGYLPQQQQQAGYLQPQNNFKGGDQNGTNAPRLNMDNSSPATFRKYILYVRPPERTTDPQTGQLMVVDVDPNSTKAMQMVRPIEQDVWIEDIANIPDEAKPGWLTGTPILVSFLLGAMWKGTQCFKMIERLCSQPLAITWGQEQGVGFNTINGAPISAYDPVPLGANNAAMYASNARLKANDVDSYMQLRQMQEQSWQSRRPAPSDAERQAILASMQQSYV